MSAFSVVRGALLNPRVDGTVDYIADAALVGDERGRIADIGPWNVVAPKLGSAADGARPADGMLMPTMLDAHVHISQHPVRGRFVEGIGDHPPEGRLLAGLNRNVFPAEARCSEVEYTRDVVQTFHEDSLAHGVIGGAAYMTVHAQATRIALEMLPDTWQVGMVLMNQNCPAYLRTDESSLQDDIEALARDFGPRTIVTDRFAVAVDSTLRRRAVALARRLGLRMQTHLNEQVAEKRFVEQTLYPECASYTDVYRRDGLLDCAPILAHCIHMRPDEFDMLAGTDALVAHCPVSNTLLGSGVMPLDELLARGLPYALCTDIGASPTTSLLCEMVQFLKVHGGHSRAATAEEALRRVTLAPAEGLGLDDRLGVLEVGKDMSFIEVRAKSQASWSAEEAIRRGLLRMEPGETEDRSGALDRLRRAELDGGAELEGLTADVRQTAERLDDSVLRVTLKGETAWERHPKR